MPVWRNWQTRTTQNRVPLECRFDPDHRYQLQRRILYDVFMKWRKPLAIKAMLNYAGTPINGEYGTLFNADWYLVAAGDSFINTKELQAGDKLLTDFGQQR